MSMLEYKAHNLVDLLMMGFEIGVVLFIIVAAARIGWKVAPWAIGIALLLYFFF